MGLTAGAAVLAAGAGSRFEGRTAKLLAPVGGEPLVRVAVRRAVEARIGPVCVVAGAVELDAALDGLAVTIVRNDRWEDGLATSLGAAVGWAARHALDAVVVGLGDQPGITADAWRAVAGADAAAQVVAAEYDGVLGHPVRLHRAVWARLPAVGDRGARDLVRADGVVAVPCPGSTADVDTVEDLEGWS